MPQLDRLAYVAEEFWLVLVFFLVYVSVASNGLRNIYKILKYREKVLSAQSIVKKDKVEKKLKPIVIDWGQGFYALIAGIKEFHVTHLVALDGCILDEEDIVRLQEEDNELDYDNYLWIEEGNALWLLKESVEELIHYEENLVEKESIIKEVDVVEIK